MPKTRRFTNPTTGGRIVVKASMSPDKHAKLTHILSTHGYREIHDPKAPSPPRGEGRGEGA